jgi:23S rRNA (pseudouridine1915-N3)-methyltransferase
VHITLCTIGKWKRSAEQELFEKYAARLPWQLELKELASVKASSPSEQSTKETAQLFEQAKLGGAHKIIALDETGRSFSSRDFAEMFGDWRNYGDHQVAILIGGDNGLDKAQLKQADKVMSLGNCTWPHLLVRTLIAEQLYRAYAILSGHPYHRE